MTWDHIAAEARRRSLRALGGFHPGEHDALPEGTGTLILLGPHEPDFWPALTESPEWQDGTADPVDRWSLRVVADLAETLDATPLFPFGGPAYQPFYRWAERSNRLQASPIRLLVHDAVGLFVSFRGALALREIVDLPPAPASPCATCSTHPCSTACPVDAFRGEGFDVEACRTFLDTDAGQDCMSRGCRARRVCPASAMSGRLDAQSAYHMRVFKG